MKISGNTVDRVFAVGYVVGIGYTVWVVPPLVRNLPSLCEQVLGGAIGLVILIASGCLAWPTVRDGWLAKRDPC